MRVIACKTNEVISIDNPDDSDQPIEVVITKIGENSVRLGVTAPATTEVHRKEIYDLREILRKQEKQP